MAEKMRHGRQPARAVAVTFDDGYVDNLRNATPLLETAGISATVYIPSGFVGTEQEFWWDSLETRVLFPGRLPETLRLNFQGVLKAWNLGATAVYEESDFYRHKHWDVFQSDSPTPRHALYRELCALFQPLPRSAQDAALAELRSQWEPARRRPDDRRCVSEAELRQLASTDGIEIGAHTVSHRRLGDADFEAQTQELVTSKTTLETWLGRPVRSLAFPYGNYTAETVAAARSAGFESAVTTEERYLRRADDPLEIPRVFVRDWNGEEFDRHLTQWQRD
ncbi:MAG: hypothetical protein QOD99_2443 [Chthoniobacter sp.]|nr:hypothetical protein [Chthoniobacter sp.]